MTNQEALARIRQVREQSRGNPTRWTAAGCALVALAETSTLAAARRLLNAYTGWPNPDLKTLALNLINPPKEE